jgi:hypothetical protein
MEDVGIFVAILSTYFAAKFYIYANLVHFVVIWYIFPCFGMLCIEKSGNPVSYLNELGLSNIV